MAYTSSIGILLSCPPIGKFKRLLCVWQPHSFPEGTVRDPMESLSTPGECAEGEKMDHFEVKGENKKY